MDEGRARFLESLPAAPAFDPCRCSMGGKQTKGWYFNKERNMWVHWECHKPSGAHRGNSPFCYECGNPFTYPVAPEVPEKYPFCPTCE